MSASFLCSHLEINNGVSPDWDAAKSHINNLSDRQLGKIFLKLSDGLGGEQFVTREQTKMELEILERQLADRLGIKGDVRAELLAREQRDELENSDEVKQWQQTYASYADWQTFDILDDLDMSPESARQRLLDAVKFLTDSWEENTIYLSSTVVLLFAGMSWGDPIEGAEELELFFLSGAAKAAGFISTYAGPTDE